MPKLELYFTQIKIMKIQINLDNFHFHQIGVANQGTNMSKLLYILGFIVPWLGFE